MNGSDSNPWIETGLRHEPTAEEQAQLRAFIKANPNLATRVAEELALNRLLRQLRDPPLPSNFTARVLAALPSPAQVGFRARWARWWRWGHGLGWAPKSALAGLILSLGLLSYLEYQHHERVELARSVTKISGVTTLVSLDVLRDFDAINRLSQVPTKVDDDLLEALK
ncbi:MAG: hypothetical protein M1608_02940 [Candidatus Omnitrophica bacterium]|nr:hypothetical protein [Candidatus Omnitrophota bacterium]